MKLSATLALITLAAAAPLRRHDVYLPGGIGPDGLSKRAIGPGTAAVLGGVVSGIVAPAVTRWATKALGPAKRQEQQVDLAWDEARAAFASGVTASVLEDGAEDGEAAICVSVPYSVDDPAKTRDAVSVSFTAGGQEAVYDCFVLAAGGKFFVAAEDVSDANVGVAGGELVDGVLSA